MKGKRVLWPLLAKRAAFYASLKVFLSLILLVYAASITTTTKVTQSETGGALNVTNNLVGQDKGFAKAASASVAAGNCPISNVTFTSSPQTANNAITAGEIVYDIQVNTTASTPTISCFTATLTLTPSGGSQTTYTVKIATGTSVSAGWTIDCKFDIGSSLPTSPFSFKVTVQ